MKLNWSTNAQRSSFYCRVNQELKSKGFTDRQIQDHGMIDKIFLAETTVAKICMTIPNGNGIAGSHEGSTRDYDDRYDAPWDNSDEINC